MIRRIAFFALTSLFLVSCGGDGPDGVKSSSLAQRQSNDPPVQVTVAKSGTGSGTVTSSDGSINCGTTCSGTSASPATLSATPEFGSLFSGWSGACSGLGACVVTGSSASAVTATFVPAASTLQMPWFTKVPGYISRFVLLNSGASDATYNVVVLTEPGNLALVRPAYASGTIKAGAQLVLNVDDLVESFTAGQRGFAFIATSAPQTTVSGIYNLVQPSTGAISNVSLLPSTDMGSSTTLVAPWVTVDDAYKGDLILTNQGSTSAAATLTYLAPGGGGITAKTSSIVIPARGQIMVDGASLATPYIGTSFGAVLTVAAPPSQIKGTYKIFRKSTGAASSTELTTPAAPTVSTALTVPWFSTAPGYESHFILINRSASAVNYTINVLPEPGNSLTLGTLTGSIPANGQTIVPASSVLLATTTATRASAVFEIAASADLVDGLYQIVSSGTGAISNTAMARRVVSSSGTSTLKLPWFSTASGYVSRLVLVNRSAADAPYRVEFLPEPGNAPSTSSLTSGTVPAGSMLVLPAADLVAFSGATRAGAVISISAPSYQVDGLYNIVNPVSGTISNTLMTHATTTSASTAINRSASKWSITRSTSSVDGTKTTTLSLYSGDGPTFNISCTSTGVRSYWLRTEFVTGSGSISYRVGINPSVAENWNQSPDTGWDRLFAPSFDLALIKQLYQNWDVVFEIDRFLVGRGMYRMTASGFSAAIDETRADCNWPTDLLPPDNGWGRSYPDALPSDAKTAAYVAGASSRFGMVAWRALNASGRPQLMVRLGGQPCDGDFFISDQLLYVVQDGRRASAVAGTDFRLICNTQSATFALNGDFDAARPFTLNSYFPHFDSQSPGAPIATVSFE